MTPTLAEIEHWLSDGAPMPPPFNLDAASAQLAELRLIYEALDRERIAWAIDRAGPGRKPSVRVWHATEPASA